MKRTQKKSKRIIRNPNNQGTRLRVWIVPKGNWMPPRIRTQLVFDLLYTSPPTTVVAPYATEILNCSNPNQVTTVSTVLPGYVSLALMYRKYIMVSFHALFTVCNNETFDIEIFLAGDNSLPVALTNPTPWFSQGNKYCRTKMLSGKGGMDKGTLSLTLRQSDFGGVSALPVSCYLEGTTDNTSPPANNVYMFYGYRNTGLATVTAPTFKIRITMVLEFYEFQSPSS
jgi:hypothetical protein